MHRRILVFAVHKAASLGVYDVMRRVAKREHWSFYSANLKVANLIEPSTPGDRNFYEQLSGKKGLFGPIRMPVDLSSKAETDQLVLHLRDPRDVLVSMFFSWSYSHPGVDEEYRSGLREKGIDAFVLRESAGLKEKYDLYIRNYLSLPGTVFLKYEEFVLERRIWMDKFLTALGVNPEQKHYIRLAENNPASKIGEEDIHAHLRKATPGDYRDKLGLETISTLNDLWREVLLALSY